MLKWCYQPAGCQQAHSWRSTIRTQRWELRLLLRDNPSLRPQVPAVLREHYPEARAEAVDDTGLAETNVPPTCPWAAAQVLAEDFWPETPRFP